MRLFFSSGMTVFSSSKKIYKEGTVGENIIIFHWAVIWGSIGADKMKGRELRVF